MIVFYILRSEEMSSIFADNLDYLRGKAKETTSGHGGSFHPNIWMIFANYLGSDVEYRRKQNSAAEVIFRLDAYIRWLGQVSLFVYVIIHCHVLIIIRLLVFIIGKLCSRLSRV